MYSDTCNYRHLNRFCYLLCDVIARCYTDRSLMAKKADGIKESTDSNATIEEDETRGWYLSLLLVTVKI